MDQDTLEAITIFGSVILGWLLGWISTFINDWRKVRKRRGAKKRALTVELHGLCNRLLAINYQVASKFGKIDRVFINWILPLARKYEEESTEVQGLLLTYQRLGEMSDDDLRKISARQKAEAAPTLFFPQMDAPYARTSAASADEFEPEFSRKLLDILYQLQVYRDTRDNLLHYQRLTFLPGLTPENHAKAVQMSEWSMEKLALRAKIVAEKIAELES